MRWARQKRTLFRVIGLVLAFGLASCAGAPPNNPDNACRIYEEKRGWYRAATKAERRWGVPDHIILSIIRQESAFDHDARPPRGRFLFVFPGSRPSSAYGYAQAIDGTWKQYKRETGRRGADRDNFADAADFVGWYGDKAHRTVGISKGDAYTLYLAYHEGPTNYRRGTHRGKRWLLKAAGQVRSRAAAYRSQLNGCEDRFRRRGIPLIPGI